SGGVVPVEAIPLALISSLYPLGLAAILVIARAQRPRPKESVFLAGALACTLAVGFVVVFALHGAGIGQSSQRSDQYWLRLVTGVVFMAVAVGVGPRAPQPRRGPSPLSRAGGPGGRVALLSAGLAPHLPAPALPS